MRLVSDKRTKKKFVEKRKERRLKWLAREHRLVDGVEIPPGAVVADHSQQVPWNSYSPPPKYYVDIEFKCRDCGREEIWTAEQQKWYYEVAKGSLFGRPIRCRECRNKIKDQKAIQRQQMEDG
jgi:hypothetical protein